MEATSNNWFTNKYPIGYALSGGFIKGFAHLGVMQSLLEHDIKPNILSGVSAGALAGVFYADGNEPHKVLDYFSGHKFQDLTKLVIPKVGLFELGEFIDFLKTNLKAKTIEELQIPLIITATDLDHGRVVHFHKGNIAERVAASCCMPVLFSPVKIEGTHYVDGGVFMNLPVSTIRRKARRACTRTCRFRKRGRAYEKHAVRLLRLCQQARRRLGTRTGGVLPKGSRRLCQHLLRIRHQALPQQLHKLGHSAVHHRQDRDFPV